MWKVSSSLAPSSVLLSPEDIIQLDAVRELVCVNWRINMYFDLVKTSGCGSQNTDVRDGGGS